MKELEEQNTDFTENVNELEEKNKELEEQQTGLDSALVKAVLSQLPQRKPRRASRR